MESEDGISINFLSKGGENEIIMAAQLRKGFSLIRTLLRKNLVNVQQGFTLIELLIVMAILGVLAVVVLVAINPVQQLARTRDSGRKSAVTQIGHATEAFYTSHGANYPDLTVCPNAASLADWLDCLVDAGELSTAPTAIPYSSGGGTVCTTNANNDICYNYNGTDSVVYTGLESDSETSKCAAGDNAWFIWSTADGRGGLVCSVGEPVPGNQTWNTVQ